jgi:hypothetical protein
MELWNYDDTPLFSSSPQVDEGVPFREITVTPHSSLTRGTRGGVRRRREGVFQRVRSQTPPPRYRGTPPRLRRKGENETI